MHEIPGGIILPWIPYIQQMVWYLLPQGPIRLRGAYVKAAVDLHGIGIDDLESMGEEPFGHLRLADGSRASKDDCLRLLALHQALCIRSHS